VVDRAELDRRRACDKELHDVVETGNAADADDRDLGRLADLMDAAEGNWLDGRAAEPADRVTEHGLLAAPIDPHAEQPVDPSHRVVAAVLRRLSHFDASRH